MIAPYPHSGQGNHHGSMTAYGGDYEAQRHWMEITLHLPISQWYKYDLSYWGLDYPPLIAYGSYFMGWASQTLVGPETVAFFDSRGYEGNPVHKSYMRATVIFWDAVVFFPALYLICKRYYGGSTESCQDKFFVFVARLYAVSTHDSSGQWSFSIQQRVFRIGFGCLSFHDHYRNYWNV
jgi:ALG6, ALG8 glycosyltransferase family.